MRHYSSLTDDQKAHLFFREPTEFDFSSDKQLLSSVLGATLYMPATRPDLVNDLQKMRTKGAGSIVICLEDSIPDDKLPEAEQNLHNVLAALVERGTVSDLPLIFVRVRTPEHLQKIAEQNGTNLSVLTGFVFPKFEDLTGVASAFVNILKVINEDLERPLYFMPVLESPNIVHRETRVDVLTGLKRILDRNKDLVLAVRIGATDMSSVYGVRRSPDFTVWDVHAVASAIGDIVNVFGRSEDNYTITGAVWEHFQSGERLFKPQLRESIFDDDKALRRRLLVSGDDTFIREIQLDRVNGLLGKTIIHPSHIPLVHSFSVVTHEEYSDALDITSGEHSHGGATSSFYRNKMNEIKPHHAWAIKTLIRADAFGVSNQDIDFIDFLEAGING